LNNCNVCTGEKGGIEMEMDNTSVREEAQEIASSNSLCDWGTIMVFVSTKTSP
jgi:hypothetical protein